MNLNWIFDIFTLKKTVKCDNNSKCQPRTIEKKTNRTL